MELSGRNQWQSVANPRRANVAEMSEIRCRELPPVAPTPMIKEGLAGRVGETSENSL
jgi:hypothetical protein